MDVPIRPPERMSSATNGGSEKQPGTQPRSSAPAPEREQVNKAAANAVRKEASTGGEIGVNKAMQHLANGALDLSAGTVPSTLAAQPVESADNNAPSAEGEQPRSGPGDIIPPSTPEPASNSSARTDSAASEVTPQIQPANEQNPASKNDDVTRESTAREATVSPATDATDANAVARGDAGGTGAEVQNTAAQPATNTEEAKGAAATASTDGAANVDKVNPSPKTDTATEVPANGPEKDGGGNGGDTGGANREQNPGTPANPTTPPRSPDAKPDPNPQEMSIDTKINQRKSEILGEGDAYKALQDKIKAMEDAKVDENDEQYRKLIQKRNDMETEAENKAVNEAYGAEDLKPEDMTSLMARAAKSQKPQKGFFAEGISKLGRWYEKKIYKQEVAESREQFFKLRKVYNQHKKTMTPEQRAVAKKMVWDKGWEYLRYRSKMALWKDLPLASIVFVLLLLIGPAYLIQKGKGR